MNLEKLLNNIISTEELNILKKNLSTVESTLSALRNDKQIQIFTKTSNLYHKKQVYHNVILTQLKKIQKKLTL